MRTKKQHTFWRILYVLINVAKSVANFLGVDEIIEQDKRLDIERVCSHKQIQ